MLDTSTGRLRRAASLTLGLAFAAALVGCESAAPLQPRELSTEASQATSVLPADARFVAMMDFKEMAANEMTSPFSNGPFSIDRIDDEAEARVTEFVRVTGFDPEKDLDRVYLAVGSKDRPESVTMVAYADYETDRIAEFIRDNSPSELVESRYRDVLVFTATDGEHEMAFALAGGAMVVGAGSQDGLESAIDRMLDGGNGLETNEMLMPLIRNVAHNSSWMAASSLVGSGDAFGDEDFSAALRDIAIGVEVRSDGIRGSSYLQPVAGVTADDLEAMIKGAVAALKATTVAKDEPDMLKMLDRVDVRARGSAVEVGFSMDNDVLRRIADDI